MERDLQTLVNTRDRLVIDSPAESYGLYQIAFFGIVVVGVFYLMYRLWPVSRLVAFCVPLIAVVIGFFVFADLGTSYRMELNRPTNQLLMYSYRGSDRSSPTGTWKDPLDAFERADIEYDRAYRRIVMTTHDGQLVRPLGPDHTIMDSQFKVLGEIQQFIGQTPTPAPNQ